MNTLKLIFSILCLFVTPFAQANAVVREWQKPLVKEVLPDVDPEEGNAKRHSNSSEKFSVTDTRPAKVKVLVYRMPKDFEYEFAVLVVEGKIERAFVISTAIEGKEPILGSYRLSVPNVNGRAWPWKTSLKYDNSPMYWGLQISGGFYIHSTPHYGNLGSPASMGCIRASIPDAMELFNAVANRYAGLPAVISINEGLNLSSSSDDATVLKNLLSISGWNLDRLHQAIQNSRTEAGLVSKGDLQYLPGVPVDAHVRPYSGFSMPERHFPTCGGANCWDIFHKDRAILRLKPMVVSKNPVSRPYSAIGLPMVLKAGMEIPFTSLFNGAVEALDPFNINQVSLEIASGQEPVSIRVCDALAKKCSRTRGPEANGSGSFLYPMYQISEQLKSSSALMLQVTSGVGTLQSAEVDYFETPSTDPI
jgi:hypothetical protein